MTGMVPLGDQAVLVSFADEQEALAFAASVRGKPAPWLVDVVQAYKTVAVFFDLLKIGYEQAAGALRGCSTTARQSPPDAMPRCHVIPCCYELGLDLERIAAHCKLPVQRVIELHADQEYTVYAIGFCPGFPYLGYLPQELDGVPRLPSPRLRVEAGSVGLTGRQTGIYTEPRPGGWNLIGRTPLTLVDVVAGYFPLRTGDRLRFQPIDKREYGRLLGQRPDEDLRCCER